MIGGSRRLAGCILGICMLLQSACYAFVPVGATSLAPAAGEYVKVRLNAEGSTALAQFLGPRVEWAEGTLAEYRGDGTVVLGVTQVRLFDGTDHFWTGIGRVEITPAQVAEMQRRELNKGRTRGASIAAGAFLLVIALAALSASGASGDGVDGGTPPPP